MKFSFENLWHNFFSLFSTNYYDIKEEETSILPLVDDNYISFNIKIDGKYKDTMFSINYLKRNFQRMEYSEENSTCMLYLDSITLVIGNLELEDYCNFKNILTKDNQNV